MFVADVVFGSIYRFKLYQQRDGLLLSGPLADKVANNPDEPSYHCLQLMDLVVLQICRQVQMVIHMSFRLNQALHTE
jgi:hypothetical protein